MFGFAFLMLRWTAHVSNMPCSLSWLSPPRTAVVSIIHELLCWKWTGCWIPLLLTWNSLQVSLWTHLIWVQKDPRLYTATLYGICGLWPSDLLQESPVAALPRCQVDLFHLAIHAKGSPRLKFGDSVIPTLGSEWTHILNSFLIVCFQNRYNKCFVCRVCCGAECFNCVLTEFANTVKLATVHSPLNASCTGCVQHAPLSYCLFSSARA